MDTASLLNSTNPREFLSQALKVQSSTEKPLSLSQFSRQCGFASRSFLSEYLAGKKKLSRDSVRSIRSSLKLSKEYKDYFSVLVAQDQPELKLYEGKKLSLPAEIHRLKSAVENRKNILNSHRVHFNQAISKKKCFLVYASLGEENKGATLAQIQKRCRLSELDCLRALEMLTQAGMAFSKNERFFAKAAALDFLNLSVSELGAIVRELGKEMISQPEDIASPKNRVVFSAFSIDSDRVSLFQERLQEAVFELMDEFQSDNGDHVQQVFFSTRM